MRQNKKLFLSAVSNEFESYRSLLAGDLKRPNLDVAVQEDFITTDGTTLSKLDTYIRACDGVVHLIGKSVGAIPEPVAVAGILQQYPDLANKLPMLADTLSQPDPGFSYTQWEAYLAIYHQRPLFVYRPNDFESPDCPCPREERFQLDPDQEKAQQRHYKRICEMGRDRGQFLNQERLSSLVLRDLVDILPALESRIDIPPTNLIHTTEQLVGREHELTLLDRAWNDPHIHVVVVRGIGGEGKTSLVATWMAELAFKNWRGAERVIDWSFYSQGTRDQTAATAEFFINQALTDLGDPDPTEGGPEARAARLAEYINRERTLLVLDGLEPLQHPPGPLHGGLKDAGMATLLRALAAKNSGLLVITTREKVTEIQQHYDRSAIDHDLSFLSPLAGAQVLYNAGARRAGDSTIDPDDGELQQASEEVKGHALTLFLMGQYLRLISYSENGDIRQRDTMRLADAEQEYKNDETRRYGHAFKAIEAYERWFADGDASAQQQLSVLRLLGLFDRPASASCLQALRTAKIDGLSDVWKGGKERDWRKALSRLEEIDLIEVTQNGTVDCHPLIREYFAFRLREHHPEAFRAGHSRLFDHLCKETPHRPDGIEGLQPLYQAVVHGCLAERQQQACVDVYVDRILRGTGSDGFYSSSKLGAIGADLSAVAAFFDEPWTTLSPNLSEYDQAWLLNEAAYSLRALGRLTEAVQPMRCTLDLYARTEKWKHAAAVASNLSQLELTLGRVSDSVESARRSVDFADRSKDAFQRMTKRVCAADALHQFGDSDEAAKLFATAETMQRENQPQYPLLYSVQGFQYCDLLLADAERAAWREWISRRASAPVPSKKKDREPGANASQLIDEDTAIAACDEVERRGAQALEIVLNGSRTVLDIALNHLTLARVSLYLCLLSAAEDESAFQHANFTVPTSLSAAVEGLRKAGEVEFIAKGLLTAAVWHFLTGDVSSSIDCLNEAQQIAARGPMPLYTADVLLTRARLFFPASPLDPQTSPYPWPDYSPAADLVEARKIIEQNHYHRRLPELQDAEHALGTGEQ